MRVNVHRTRSVTVPHVLIIVYDDAGCEISQQSNKEVEAVDDGERDQNTQLLVGLSKIELDKLSF